MAEAFGRQTSPSSATRSPIKQRHREEGAFAFRRGVEVSRTEAWIAVHTARDLPVADAANIWLRLREPNFKDLQLIWALFCD